MNLVSYSDHIIITDSGCGRFGGGAIPPNRAITGDVWYNPSLGSLEVYDGCNWNQMENQTIDLGPEAYEALQWVAEQRQKEQKLKELANDHVAVANALKQVQEAEEKLSVITALADADYEK